MATDMDVDMDVDMDLDLGLDPTTGADYDDGMRIESATDPHPSDAALQEPANVDTSNRIAENKVHVRGLDTLTTDDISKWAAENYPAHSQERVEWVDDTSANLIYSSAEICLQALVTLSSSSIPDPNALPTTQLRPAKTLSTYPTIELSIRQAFVEDVKKQRAHEASRFYLLNPDKDPREIHKQRRGGERGRRRRYSDERGDYRRRQFDDREHRRRQGDAENGGFDVAMYDDDAGDTGSAPRRRRRGSGSDYDSQGEDDRRRNTRGRRRPARDDLFLSRADRASGRLRNRSASPVGGDGDGRLGFDDTGTGASHRRSSTQGSIFFQDQDARDKSNKELFPFSESNKAGAGEDLFLRRNASTRRSRELFPHKTDRSNHRRSDALDVYETKDLARKASTKRDDADRPAVRDLASRIGVDQPPNSSGGFSVLGQANVTAAASGGFSIRGAADSDRHEGKIKELFPLKTGSNVGKELFSDNVKGRSGARRKAEDMF